MKTIILTGLFIAFSFFTLSACNTFEGVGEDLEQAGEYISGTAKKAGEE